MRYNMSSSLPGSRGAQSAGSRDRPELNASLAGAAQPLRAALPGPGEAVPEFAAAANSWTGASLPLLRPTDS